MYLNSCQDQQLRSILERQQRHTLDTFQRLVQMMQTHGMDTSRIPMPSALTNMTTTSANMTAGGPQTTQYGTQMASQQPGGAGQYNQYTSAMYPTGNPGIGTQMTGQTVNQTNAINDKVISEGALLFHKCSADNNTRAALESSEPHIRGALTNMARNCIEMSYELYNYMSQRGWYQLPATPQNFISHSPNQQQQYPQQ